MGFTEEAAINIIAQYERSIVGIRNSYGFSQNPDVLTLAMLPACIHYVPSVTATPRAHHNAWANTINLRSIVFVEPRQSQGGKLKFLEGAVIPYSQLWRAKFQDHDVITSILASTGSIKCWWNSGAYGAGPPLLSYNAQDFLGWSMSFTFVSA